ncbi:phenylacetate--CoA ligase family protein [Flavobacterium sp. JP2137]|uniref:phenylacetate--CoA ligase family protein n=1 Tax=Flavobacterium sp. JP2137 TaxID=3414510 RepID=UPI003D2FAE37
MQIIPSIELASTAAIKTFQEGKLRELLAYLSAYSPYYRRQFKAAAIDVASIQSLEDLTLLPVTTKDDLQAFNDDFFCVPKTSIIDYATTSGTLGNPVTFGLTDGDLDRLAYNEMISFQCAGIQKGDVVQLMTTMDRRFMAGLAYFLGLRKLGAGVIRVGAGIPQLQWDSILKYQPKYLIGVPSFLLKLIEFAENNHIDYQQSSIRGVICIGETLRTADLKPNILAQRITDKWDIHLFSTYASTEMSAAFTECQYLQGGHHHPELIITEILDDDNREVAAGQIGELTVTTLGIEALPLLRFKTGDMVRKHQSDCGCGRTTYRIGPVEGRKQHMIKYKGTTLYPPAMHDLLASFDEIKLHLIEISNNDIGTDDILIRIVTTDSSPHFLNVIKDLFRAKLRVTPRIVFNDWEELQKIVFNPMNRKPTTFIDKRDHQHLV